MKGKRFSINCQLVNVYTVTWFLVNIFTVSWNKVSLLTFVLPIHLYEGNLASTPLEVDVESKRPFWETDTSFHGMFGYGWYPN